MTPSNRHPRARKHLARKIVAGATLVSFLGTSPYAMAGMTEISNAPLASSSTATIPPNVMFVLDASGSMNSWYMPDDIDGKYDSERVGSVSHYCNTLYYNPSVKYLPAKNADGSDFPNATFSAAENDPFSSDSPSGTTDLRSKFRPWGDWSEQRGFYFRYDGTWDDTWDQATKDGECKVSGSSYDGTGNDGKSTGATPKGAKWTKVEMSAAEEQNFANWFTYYRTRLLLMKSAAGHAFNGLNDTFRVGFITICPQDGASCNSDTTTYTVSASKYLKIDNFTSAHKSAWYDKFYAQRGSSYTPLRQALARVGRHYAGKTDNINAGMPDDPVQYSCQQNFAILTTDGYWNYGYGRRIDGSTMDNQDSDFALTPLPMLDGKIVTNTTITNQQEKWSSRSGSPSCSAPLVKARKEARTETIVNSVDAAGVVTTTTTYSGTTTTNTCALPAALTGTWTTVSSTSTAPVTTVSGGVGNTLADVAEYYYRNDLRPTGSKNAKGDLVDTNNVPSAGTGVEDDNAKHQHMTTFTLGLGVSGTLNFQPNYQTGAGDFAALRNNSKQWPNPDPTSSGSTSPKRIDDLWHAAVNGRGQAFSATDPVTLAVSLQTALTAINARLSSAAAAATSSLEPTLTDRLVFTPTYTTAEWSGELQAKELDITTGAVGSEVVWSAQPKLDARTKAACDTRKIMLHRPGAGTTNLVDFTWNSDTCTGGVPTGSPTTALDDTEKGYFSSTQAATLTQWGLMTEDGAGPLAEQKSAAVGANLVNFVRGQRGKESFEPNNLDKLYRERAHVLGDIVNSQPMYVRQPYFDYDDAGYADFKTKWKDRTPMVYVAANDGMLHAFNGTPDKVLGGEEAWAVIPREVLPRLHRLADTNYSKLHEYTVDGTPTVSDVYDPVTKEWRTIMVAPLNKGGRAYYALDITDPDPAKVTMLWEFNSTSDKDLGYSYGNPLISKLEDGRWVVFVTSGLNNVSPGDGQGYLYVLDAVTGALIYKIGTGVGDTTTPSGLTKIRNWVGTKSASQDNTTARVYGVDVLGNIWRFDVNNKLGLAGPTAQRMATAKDPSGNPQPLTTRPELAEVGSPPEPYVYVASGRYLGASDVTDKQVQSIYAIKDTLSSTPIADLRTELQQRIMTTDGTDRFTCTEAQKSDPTCDPTNAPNGWFVDLIDSGERVNVDMKLQLGTLVVASNVPANSACEPGGYSYKNYFDYATGLSPAGIFEPVGGRLSSALAVGINIIRLPDGRIVVIGMDSSGTPQTFEAPLKSGVPSGKRITWREIPQ
jgi:type IV pilus assembly protein PilY1